MAIVKIKVRRKGGPGSGNWNHKGRPGLHGGSAPGGSGGKSKRIDDAIKSYSSGLVLNPHLRRGLELNAGQRKVIAALDSAMEPIRQEITLYRGIKPIQSTEEQRQVYGIAGKMQIGHTWKDLGFASTSEHVGQAHKFAKHSDSPYSGDVWRIHMQPTNKALRIGNRGHFFEDEWLLPRGTTFRLTGREYDSKKDVAYYDVEIID